MKTTETEEEAEKEQSRQGQTDIISVHRLMLIVTTLLMCRLFHWCKGVIA